MNRLNRIVVLLPLACLGVNYFAFSQLPNQAFEEQFNLNDSDSVRLNFELSGLGYFRNNEFFDTNVEGYTLFGYQINPRLNLQLNRNFSILAGAFLRKNFGSPDFEELVPTFTLKYQKKKFSLIFGNLEGSLAHRLIEPIYGFENVILRRQENGLQFIYRDEDKYRFDGWIDWEKTINPGSKFKERLWGGFSGRIRLMNTAKWRLVGIGQITAYHIGGQIDSSTDPTLTQVEYVPGFELAKTYSQESFINEISFQPYFSYQLNNSEVSFIQYREAWGAMINLTVSTRYFDVMASYWDANRYASVLGGNLYQAYNFPFPDSSKSVTKSQLLFIRFMKDWLLVDGCVLTARVEPFYDIRVNQFNYSYGLYLNYRLGFKITALKPIDIF